MSSIRVLRHAAVALTAALAGISCTDTTAPVRRFAVLDDVGQSDWASVSTGGDHTCALKQDGTAYCWGSNQYGQLGIAAHDTTCGAQLTTYPCSLTPQLVSSTVKFTSISAGQRHTCGITINGAAFCWGANDANQLSDASPGGPTMVQVAGALPWVEISAGYTHTCAVRSDGGLYCWGANDSGQLGNGTFNGGPGPVRASLSNVAWVTTSQSRTCARTTADAVYCWGAIWTDSENGANFFRRQASPAAVPFAPTMAGLSVGSSTTCGTDKSGGAYCWEGNNQGEMGNGTVDGNTMPLPVDAKLQFAQIAAGLVQTCGLTTSGTVYCWGDDSFGQLGVSPGMLPHTCTSALTPCATLPVAVIGRQQFTEISTGLGSHTCGVTVKGNLYCWGLGVSGQRGDNSMISGISTPLQVVEPAKPTAG